MPSSNKSFGLGAITAWLSGSSKPVNDESAYERPAKPTDSKAADELAAKLEATTLSKDTPTDAESSNHEHKEHGKEKESLSKDGKVHEYKSGNKCSDSAFEMESAFEKAMEEAWSREPEWADYYDALANVYHSSPSQIARQKFLTKLINDLQEQNWIGLDSNKKVGIKVIDYAAGTGALSHALAPYVTEILAIDKSLKMVEKYNEIATKENQTQCQMKAVQGDMTTHLLTSEETGIERPDGAFAGFDMVAMCFAVDFFIDAETFSDENHPELLRSLSVMKDLLKENGTILIIDIEKCPDEDCFQDSDAHAPGSGAHEGLKVDGIGSASIVKALEELGMVDIAVVGDQHFLFEVKQGQGVDAAVLRKKETYFVLKATKRGPLSEK